MPDNIWEDLYHRWKDSLAEGVGQEIRQPGHWFSIWRLIISHDWFQRKLHDCAVYTVRSSGLPHDLTEDLEQEVVLMLAGKLSRRRDLGMNLELAEQKFPAFVGTVIRNDCRQAARKLRRQFLRSNSLSASERVVENRAGERATLVELSLAIEELEDPQRTILLLSLKGMTLKDIAQAIEMNYSKVCREYHHGCRQLEKTL